jgi:hypothetical protein
MEGILLLIVCAVVAFVAIRVYIDRNKPDAGGSSLGGSTHEDGASK